MIVKSQILQFYWEQGFPEYLVMILYDSKVPMAW